MKQSKNLLAFLLFVCLMPMAAHSQDTEKSEKPPKTVEQYSEIILGWQRSNLSEINAQLKQLQYDGFSNNFLNVGWNCGWIFRRKIALNFGTAGILNLKSPKSNNNNNSSAFFAGITNIFGAGYYFLRTDKIALNVEANAGLNLLNLHVNDRNEYNSFNAAFTSRNSSTNISVINFISQFSVGFHYVTHRKMLNCDRPLQHNLGVKVGYQYGGKSTWASGNNEIAGPSFSPRGPFVRLTFGQIWEKRKKDSSK